jgi:hypothetical protein
VAPPLALKPRWAVGCRYLVSHAYTHA